MMGDLGVTHSWKCLDQCLRQSPTDAIITLVRFLNRMS